MSDIESEEDGTLDTLDDLLWLIREMPLSVSTVRDLLEDCAARNIGCEPFALADLLVQGQAEGLIDVWGDPETGAGHVTLSPLAAERLGVQLTRGGDRWVTSKREPPDFALMEEGQVSIADIEHVLGHGDAYRPGDECRPGKLDASLWIDPSLPEPIDMLIEAEDAGTLLGPGQWRLRDGSRVFVSNIIGLGMAWPQAFVPLTEVIEGDGFAIVRSICRGCGRDANDPRARYGRNAACVVCDRAGIDGKMPAVEPVFMREQGEAQRLVGNAARSPLVESLIRECFDAARRFDPDHLKGGKGGKSAPAGKRGRGAKAAVA